VSRKPRIRVWLLLLLLCTGIVAIGIAHARPPSQIIAAAPGAASVSATSTPITSLPSASHRPVTVAAGTRAYMCHPERCGVLEPGTRPEGSPTDRPLPPITVPTPWQGLLLFEDRGYSAVEFARPGGTVWIKSTDLVLADGGA
jgi:hypothetical protein